MDQQEPNLQKYATIDVIDPETRAMFYEYAHDNAEMVKDIIDSFQPEADELIDNIKELAHGNDPEQLRYNIHSLTGICGSIGAMQLRQIAVDVEVAIKAGQMDTACALAKVIPENYTQLLSELKKF
ncbi:MAG: Hpt domain-containing protein [Bacteroidales bacterium]